MIKLIATDIDGTLVRDSSPEMYPEMLETIKKLTDKGIIFVAASGRQYHSIRRLFKEVEDRLVYIAENGAHIVYKGKPLSVVKMNREDAVGIVEDMREYTPDCELLVSAPEGSYMETKNEEFVRWIDEAYRNQYKIVEDVLEEEIEIIKVSLFQKDSIREIGETKLIPKWEPRVKACMAGEEWVDFMDKSVDKGHALKQLQEYFGITKEETMAFGDNNNDVGLVSAAGESYAVENAVEEVKKSAKHICPSFENKGVYQILKKLV